MAARARFWLRSVTSRGPYSPALVARLALLACVHACAHPRALPPAFDLAARLPPPPPSRPPPNVGAPPSVPSVARSPEVPAPPVSGADIGQAGPLRFLAASADASWVALCQGEPSRARLVIGSGMGEPIDRLLAYDRAGRYVAVEQAGELVLVDASLGQHVSLGNNVDLRRSREDFAPHRALAFDDRGERFAYVRGTRAEAEIVVRDLASTSERSFALGPGDLYRLAFDAGGRRLVLEVVRADPSNHQRPDWPVPEEQNDEACAPRPLRFRTFAGAVAALRTLVWDVETGVLREVPGFVSTLGSSLVTRTFDGALWLEEGRTRHPLAPAICAARVLFADAERKLALIGCKAPKKPGRRELWLVGRGFPKSLQVDVAEAELDRSAVSDARLVPVYPGADSALLDLEKSELVALAPGSRVLLTHGPQALIWRGNDVLRFDVEASTEMRVARGIWRIPQLLRAGSEAVLLSPFVLALMEDARLAPSLPALALARSGHVLVASRRPEAEPASPSAPMLPEALEGPLRWQSATVAPDDGPLH